MKGVVSDKDFYSLVMHFFNHQTHHRGQVTTLLSQAGVDVGDGSSRFDSIRVPHLAKTASFQAFRVNPLIKTNVRSIIFKDFMTAETYHHRN